VICVEAVTATEYSLLTSWLDSRVRSSKYTDF